MKARAATEDSHSFYSVYEVNSLSTDQLHRQPPSGNVISDRPYENIISLNVNKNPVYIQVDTTGASGVKPTTVEENKIIYSQIQHPN